MDAPVVFWLLVAVLVFWAVGAYNRLIRLRSQAIGAFAVVNEHFLRYIGLVRANASLMNNTGLAELVAQYTDTLTQAWIGVDGAATQFDASLKIVSQRPLDAVAMSAMQTAYSTLCSSWERLQNEPPDLAGHRIPEVLQQDWAQVAVLISPARADFNRLVVAYNEAISQFPASILAWLFGFKPARTA
ncbi:MAG: hypothetical protein RL211_1663 [Pseudomonadota bacterium]|jgi:LemA protein